MKSKRYTLTPQERDNVLAALRLWQSVLTGREYIDPMHVADLKRISEYTQPPMDADGIDALCEKLNK